VPEGHLQSPSLSGVVDLANEGQEADGVIAGEPEVAEALQTQSLHVARK